QDRAHHEPPAGQPAVDRAQVGPGVVPEPIRFLIRPALIALLGPTGSGRLGAFAAGPARGAGGSAVAGGGGLLPLWAGAGTGAVAAVVHAAAARVGPARSTCSTSFCHCGPSSRA